MGGLITKLGQHDVEYIPAGALAPKRDVLQTFDELEDRILAAHERMRRIFVRVLPHWPLSYYVLHWSDGSDLHALDARVSAGVATELDFRGALVGEANGIVCQNCHAALRVVTAEATGILFTREEFIERSTAHQFKPTCPVCHQKWNASVLEFIDHSIGAS